MPTIILATKTLALIESTLAADQGASFRQNLQKVLPHIGDAYRGVEDNPFRSHLGASVIGKTCSRALYYGFRWATKPNFEGRILRLFGRGHLEEGRFIAILLACGIEIFQQDSEGKQFRISDCGGHFGGSGDGVAIGIPDLPAGMPCLLEFKTHNDKSFKKLQKEGLFGAKPEHAVQMQLYLNKMGLGVGLYMAVNKNDDEIYAELLPVDNYISEQYAQRAREIIFATEPPKRISESPGWYACKYCDHKAVCHNRAEPEHNCRTCKYADCNPDGKWYCGYEDEPKLLHSKEQVAGCEHWQRLEGL